MIYLDLQGSLLLREASSGPGVAEGSQQIQAVCVFFEPAEVAGGLPRLGDATSSWPHGP